MSSIKSRVAAYYTKKINKFGATPQGVDWNGELSQTIRFSQLCKVLPSDPLAGFSILDLGCGYAALYDFLIARYPNMAYSGIDISKEMVATAQRRLKGILNAKITMADQLTEPVDYAIASGLFNVCQDVDNRTWEDYVLSILENMNEYCGKGFSFNCLTRYSDKEKMLDSLYYASPEDLFSICKKKFSRNIALLHDYNLYEFTILVRKI